MPSGALTEGLTADDGERTRHHRVCSEVGDGCDGGLDGSGRAVRRRGRSTTSRWTPASAYAATCSGVIRPRGVTLNSSSPTSAGRSTRSAVARKPKSEAATSSGVRQ